MLRNAKIWFALSALVFSGCSGAIPLNRLQPKKATTISVKDTDYQRLASGINLATDPNTYSMGNSNLGLIFDYTSEEFHNIFRGTEAAAVNVTEKKKGESASEIASVYQNTNSMGAGTGLSIPYADVKFNADASFGTDIKGSLSGEISEFFEFYQVNHNYMTVAVNWARQDPTNYFSNDFILDYQDMETREDAAKILKNYGSHVFNNYSFGGVIFIHRYVASEKKAQEAYSEKNLSLDLDLDIANAISANANGSNYAMSNTVINNSSTKSRIGCEIYGGNLTSIDLNGLFAYHQEFASGYKSAYPYEVWGEMIDNGEKLIINGGTDPVSLWDIISKSPTYHDEAKEKMLSDAFDAMCLSTYSSKSMEMGVNPRYVEKIEYTSDGITEEISPKNKAITLPAGCEASFVIGDELLDIIPETDLTYSLSGSKKDLEKIVLDGKVVKIGEEKNGASFAFEIKYLGYTIYSLTINVKKEEVFKGFGTQAQPYIISSSADWKAFMSNSDNANKFAKLNKNIDLGGDNSIKPFGASGKEVPFVGGIDGDGHTVSNFSFLIKESATETWGNYGILALNKGTIKNIKFSHVRLLNDDLLVVPDGKKLNAGIVAGENKGVIKNVSLEDCSIRLAIKSNMDDSNIGLVCGQNTSLLNFVDVNGCHLSIAGNANIGGLIGHNYCGQINNSLVRNTVLQARYYPGASSNDYRLGGLVGYAAYDSNNNQDQSMIVWCMYYKNTVEDDADDRKFGTIVGEAKERSLSLQNVYFEYAKDQAMNRKSADGANWLTDLKFDYIDNSTKNVYWTKDSDGYPILK